MLGKESIDAEATAIDRATSTLNFISSNAAPKIQSVSDFSLYNTQFSNIEEMALVFLFDDRQRPIGHICAKSVRRNVVDFSLRELVRIALDTHSCSMLIAHNHPSGDATPSHTDIEKTRDILRVAQPLKISLHDHIIYTTSGKFSFKSHGLI